MSDTDRSFSQSPPRRPRLLVLVYAASMALLATTLAGVVISVNEHLRSVAVSGISAGDRALVATFLRDRLLADDLGAGAGAARRANIEAALEEFAADSGLLGALIRGSDGTAMYGEYEPESSDVLTAVTLDAALAGRATTIVLEPSSVLVEHLPVVDEAGHVQAIVTLERDATSLLAAATAASRDIVVILGTGALVLAGVLWLIFRAAQQMLTRRTVELVDATRRDTLTGFPKHGTVVGMLTETLETARASGGWVIVALLDVDGFRLLNETHGYAVGDRILRFVAEALRSELPDGAIAGRSGPDEFLLIGPPGTAPEIRPAIDRLRVRLANSALRIEGADPLTITVSVGAASYPEHAASTSELLAVAGLMLADARTGGGNRVRIDAPEPGAPPGRWSAFSILEGLIVAVDAKDRYTRRHSEQVAEYASLLAVRLGMDPAAAEGVRLAALLHDVGKIGVPDVILRKPGPLTDDERTVIEQHSVLGEAIVGCLPGFESVARGIRHHHERWDGNGYPDRLEGEAIPLLARVVTVADAYSAMTTHRSYRSRLTPHEARRRLAEGSGTQFDPTLTSTFLAALDALADGEVPLEDAATPEPSRAAVRRPATA